MGRKNRHNEIAQKTFAEFGRRLGDGLAPIVKSFCPKIIILSGNIANAYDLFAPTAKQALQTNLTGLNIAANIVLSDLVDKGGVLGAAFRAFYPNRPFQLE